MSTPETTMALYVAIYTKDVAAARRALAESPGFVHQVEFGYPWLIHAVRVGSVDLVRMLDEHGADLHRPYADGAGNEAVNALSLAVRDGKDDIAAYLRSRGASVPGAKPKARGGPRKAAIAVAPGEAAIVGAVRGGGG